MVNLVYTKPSTTLKWNLDLFLSIWLCIPSSTACSMFTICKNCFLKLTGFNVNFEAEFALSPVNWIQFSIIEILEVGMLRAHI